MVGDLTPQDHFVDSAITLVNNDCLRVDLQRSQNLWGKQDFRGPESRW